MKRGALIACALLALGCDAAAPTDAGIDGGADGGLVIPDRVPLSLYCELAPTFWCGWLERCRRGCDAYFAGIGADARSWCEAIAAQVDAGRVAYDEARASECLRLAQSELGASCEEGEESRGALHDCVPFEGLGAPGDECVLPFPLESTCDPARGTCSALPFSERCPGACVAYLREGEACDPTSGAACDPELLCIEGACVRPAAEGEPCDALPCAGGLRCVDDAGALTCRPIRGLGEPCASPEECAEGLGCSPETSECVEALPRGAPCRTTNECAAGDHCALDGTCAPLLAAGEPCDGDGCADGLACAFDLDAAEPRCQALASLDEPCDPGVCADGLWCRHADGVNRCAPVGAIDGDCSGEPEWSPHARCESGAFCNEAGTCEAQRAADEPCDSSSVEVPQCEVDAGVLCDPFTDSCLAPGSSEGARCLGVCTDGLYCDVDVCAPRVPLNEPCPPGDSCVEGAECADLDGTGPRCWERARCGE